METFPMTYAVNLLDWARDKPEVVVLSYGINGFKETGLFSKEYPDRFLELKITGKNLISIAYGIAGEGYIPIIHTSTNIIFHNAFGELAASAAGSKVPLRIIGFPPDNGGSKEAEFDISVIRTIPDMTVIECCDATDIECVLHVAHTVKGPVYIRMISGDIPRLFPRNIPMCIGEPRFLSEGNDIAVFSCGICTGEAMTAVNELKKTGIFAFHLHISTLKPFPADNDQKKKLLDIINNVKYGVITVENHPITGGLGSIVAELMAESGIGKRLYRLGLPDVFINNSGSRNLIKQYGLDAISIIRLIEKILHTTLGIDGDDLK